MLKSRKTVGVLIMQNHENFQLKHQKKVAIKDYVKTHILHKKSLRKYF
jgi:hypothetical protein